MNSNSSLTQSRKDAKVGQENVIAKSVVDAAYQIHSALGPGLLESVYERILAYELRKRGYVVETQVAVPLTYDGHTIDEAFRADTEGTQQTATHLSQTCQ